MSPILLVSHEGRSQRERTGEKKPLTSPEVGAECPQETCDSLLLLDSMREKLGQAEGHWGGL